MALGVGGGLLSCIPVVFSSLLGMRRLPSEMEPAPVAAA
jgi:hypothetical protein